jgi:arsenite methyltransferase
MAQELKDKIKERYSKIAISGNSESCCMPGEYCDSNASPKEALLSIGYNRRDLDSVPESSILGVGCGAPLNFANLKKGEIVVDLGSGAGIDVFLAAKQVADGGKVIGIDFTDDMLKKATDAAKKYKINNVEFRKGDIENSIPVEDHSADAVISNCVINLTTNKINAFKEVYRTLKQEGKGRIVISDLVTSKEVYGESINTDEWCSCIEGALTRENYINSIKEAGFREVKILNEQVYLNGDKAGSRKITSLVIGALT